MVEIVLKAKDASDWSYRGEGGLNIVLAYNGSSPNFIGKVLRVRKVKRNEAEAPSGLSAQERLLFKDVGAAVAAPSKDIANHVYARLVLSPLLGSQHVDAGVRVLVTKEFLELIDNGVLLDRPSWRVDDGRVNTLLDSAILMSDHSMFSHAAHEEADCISVEIKPKCGFLPTSRFIRQVNAVKTRISRFRLHQILKFHQRKISQISEYDPLDMFSGSKGRVLKSIKDLFLTPQNNFRVFLNGRLVFGSLGGESDDTDAQIAEAFEDKLKGFFKADDEGMRTPDFLQLVAGAVSESGILDRLLQVQKLDVLDIEGAIHAYYDVVSQPCAVCRELQLQPSDTNVLHSVPFDQSLKIVRDFLISLTAKDLSLMISFRPTPKGDSQSTCSGNLYLESLDRSFDYKASFIDLDMKPLKKMPYYYKLDQEIVSCYTQMLKTVNHPDKSETLYQDQPSAVEDNSYT